MDDARYSARGSGELIAAIIQLAFYDIFAPTGTSGERQHSQHEAIALLTSSRGEWAKHRNFLCTAIGIDGNIIAQHVRDILEGRASPKLKVAGHQSEGELTFTQHQIDAARAVYQRQFNRPKPNPAKPTPTEAEQPPKPAIDLPPPSALTQEWETNISAT